MARRQPPVDGPTRKPTAGWWTQGVVWWGVLVFAASIGGCIWLIVVAQRYADPPLEVSATHVMDVPVARPSASPAASPRAPASP